ncbi:hypothetical protein [Clostridium sp. VAP23]|uniref:hypothetical protein n=1 Tax=Clostridium sp. VAP23 TaxID=2949981 RepID=UPI002079868E|nr:hypothetical protein [Clostridium sp. VAP23]
MIARDMFEKLGYKLTEKNSKNDIQYTKKSKESEMQRIGMITTEYIEFYNSSKEIIIYKTYEFRDGTISKSDSGILSFEEFNAAHQQILELKWVDNNGKLVHGYDNTHTEYLKLLEEKAKGAIPINEISDNLRSLGQYVEEYPQIHRVEVFEDDDKKIYRLDLK